MMPATNENTNAGTGQYNAPGTPKSSVIPATKKGMAASWLNTSFVLPRPELYNLALDPAES